MNFLALRKDPIGVGVNTALTSKAICRYLESSLIFLAKNVSLGWNVTTKGTPLVASSRVLFFQLTYSLTIFLGIHPFQMLSFFTNEEPDYILSIFLCALDEKTGSVNTDGDPSLI